jgi:hypothetical protein
VRSEYVPELITKKSNMIYVQFSHLPITVRIAYLLCAFSVLLVSLNYVSVQMVLATHPGTEVNIESRYTLFILPIVWLRMRKSWALVASVAVIGLLVFSDAYSAWNSFHENLFTGSVRFWYQVILIVIMCLALVLVLSPSSRSFYFHTEKKL